MNIEVATAICAGNAKRSIIAGTSKAPPPIPNNPDINPTIKAIKIARNGGNW